MTRTEMVRFIHGPTDGLLLEITNNLNEYRFKFYVPEEFGTKEAVYIRIPGTAIFDFRGFENFQVFD
jgi:hypothetical protein